MTNVTVSPAGYPHFPHPGHDYGMADPPPQFPSAFAPQQHPGAYQQQPFQPHQIYQNFQQQYGMFQPQPNQPMSAPSAHHPVYTSAPYQNSVPATNTPPRVSQAGGYPASGAQSMAAPAAPYTPNNTMQQRQANGANLSQQAQLQNVQNAIQSKAQNATPAALSPQAEARERARVSVLLDINTHLLQEVVSLQDQGKAPVKEAGSPTSATDPSNPTNPSPIDSAKPMTAPSPEYVDCMRRLQANLSYLAAFADPKKRASGQLPPAPVIMIPPPHLNGVADLYKKLNSLFPNAAQNSVQKAMAMASSQTPRPNPPQVQANG